MTKRERKYIKRKVWDKKPYFKVDNTLTHERGLVDAFGSFRKANNAIICMTDNPKIDPLRGKIVFKKERTKYVAYGIIL